MGGYVLPTAHKDVTAPVEHQHCNNNFTLLFNGHCASILAENQVDPRKSMNALVGWKRTWPEARHLYLGRVVHNILQDFFHGASTS